MDAVVVVALCCRMKIFLLIYVAEGPAAHTAVAWLKSTSSEPQRESMKVTLIQDLTAFRSVKPSIPDTLSSVTACRINACYAGGRPAWNEGLQLQA